MAERDRAQGKAAEPRLIEGQTFCSLHDRGDGVRVSNLTLRRCVIHNASVGHPRPGAARAVVEDVTLIDCSGYALWLETTVVRRCLVDGFKSEGSAWCTAFGSVFDRVTMRGKVGSLVVRPSGTSGDPAADLAIVRENAQLYASIPWALDIREARLRNVELLGVPARLVRRDPATQVVITRESTLRALGTEWPRSLGERAQAVATLEGRVGNAGRTWSGFPTALLDSPVDDVVLAARGRRAGGRCCSSWMG